MTLTDTTLLEPTAETPESPVTPEPVEEPPSTDSPDEVPSEDTPEQPVELPGTDRDPAEEPDPAA